MTEIPADQKFLAFVLNEIVDHPDAVKITRKKDEFGVLLEFSVHPDDTGKVIGKGGQTIKSLRILLRIVGAKDHPERVNLRLLDSENENG